MLNPSPSRPAGRYPTAFSTSSLGWSLLLLLAGAATSHAGLQTVWQIGKPDNSNAEFALAPKGHTQFKDDGFFIVGQSDSRQDWPYVHPGPLDGWSGARPHTFTVIFGVASTPEGDAKLEFDLLDTQSKTPPELRVQVNGESFSLKTPKGAGDESIYGQPAMGREHKAEVAFPASLLKPGNNRIEITTVSGSWILYDSLSLNAPESVTSVAVAAFTELGEVKVSATAGEQGAAPIQMIRATVLHAGPPTEAAFTLHGKPLRTTQLAAGRQVLEFPAPAVERARSAAFAMTIAGTTIAQRDVNLTPGVREIIVVFKTHFDIGYTDMASNVVTTLPHHDDRPGAGGRGPEPRPAARAAVRLDHPGLADARRSWRTGRARRRSASSASSRRSRKAASWSMRCRSPRTPSCWKPEDLVRGLGYSSRLARDARA